MIVAQAMTHGSADDTRSALDLIDGLADDIASFTADAAYDTLAIYDASAARGIEVVVPPSKSATRSRQRGSPSNARDVIRNTIDEIRIPNPRDVRGGWATIPA